MLLTLLLACAHDPPMRPVAALPYIAERGLVYPTEQTAIEDVRATMAMAGFAGVGQAEFQFSEPTLFPVTRGTTIILRRTLSSPALAREHLAEVGEGVFGRPFTFPGWTDEDLWAAYQAFYVATIGHELSHVVAFVSRSADFEQFAVEEARARRVEWPLLHRLAKQHHIPARWVELYPRFLESMLSEVPQEVWSAVPTNSAEARAVFEEGYRALSEGEALGSREAQVAALLALRLSHEYTLEPPVELESLLDAYHPAADATLLLAREELLGLHELGYTVELTNGTFELRRADSGVTTRVEVNDSTAQVRVRVRSPLSPPAKAQPDVLRLVNAANLSQHFTLRLEEDGWVSLDAGWLSPVMPGDVSRAVLQANMDADRWLSAMQQVVGGTRSADDAIRWANESAQESP